MTTADGAPSAGALKVTVPCAHCRALNRVDLARLAAGPRCARCREPIALDRSVALDIGRGLFHVISAVVSLGASRQL